VPGEYRGRPLADRNEMLNFRGGRTELMRIGGDTCVSFERPMKITREGSLVVLWEKRSRSRGCPFSSRRGGYLSQSNHPVASRRGNR